MDKKQTRLRRARRTRSHIKKLGANRLCIHRTPRHIYAQVISPEGDRVMVSASTLDKDVRKDIGKTGDTSAAIAVGKTIAERAARDWVAGFAGFHA